MRIRSLAVAALAASLLVHTAWAEGPTAKTLKDSATQLEQQSAKLAAAIQRHQAEAKKKSDLEAKLAGLRKQRTTAKTDKERALLDTQIGEGERQIGELSAALLAHLKVVAQEAREGRRFERQTHELAVAAQAAKIKTDNAKIDAGMAEAHEKADNAMRAAELQLQMSVVAAALQLSAAPPASSAPTPPK